MTNRPVSDALETDLGAFVRQQGLVVWLDKDALYTGLADEMRKRHATGESPLRVIGYRGSHIELMFDLEAYGSTIDKMPLVIHMPGFNTETIRDTPALEMYKAGARYWKALDTLIERAAMGRVRHEEIASYLDEAPRTLADADRWLAGKLGGDKSGLAGKLELMSVIAVVDDLMANGDVAHAIRDDPEATQHMWSHLAVKTGLNEGFIEAAVARPEIAGRGEIAPVVASWALCVEYVHDLRRPPAEPYLKALVDVPKPLVAECGALATHIRDKHADFYASTALDVQAGLQAEQAHAKPEDLGRVDTFPFEEARIRAAAFKAMGSERWDAAADYSKHRLEGDSFWLRRDPNLRLVWTLIESASRVGQAITEHGSDIDTAGDLADAVDHYAQHGAHVDRAHRELEQKRAALLRPELPDCDELRDRLDGVRVVYRSWADRLARGFASVCESRGFLADETLQQRHIFDQVVRPLTNDKGTTAYFIVDALRYEMARALFNEIDKTPGTKAKLAARLSELPSITPVGMNVLAPVVDDGRLNPVMKGDAFAGFKSAEFTVATPEQRRRAMQERVGSAKCPSLTLNEVLDRDETSLRRAIASASLVVVHSIEVDAAGEHRLGMSEFERILRNLRDAWALLRRAGVRNFVFTADHGFLLLDDTTRKSIAHGKKTDPYRRYAVYPGMLSSDDTVSVPMSSLGYRGVDKKHLLFARDTRAFDRGKTTETFVHGGNSPQERIIPVLTVHHKGAAGSDSLRYDFTVARAVGEEGGLHRVQGRVEAVQGGLAFGGAATIEIELAAKHDEVKVELCDARNGARIKDGAVVAHVGKAFEVLFRLSGRATRAVQVELRRASSSVQLEAKTVQEWFAMSVTGERVEPQAVVEAGWLDALPEEARQLFAHLKEYDSLSEEQAMQMLGGARALRRFSRRLEEYVALAPFSVRIETISGTKRYVRE